MLKRTFDIFAVIVGLLLRVTADLAVDSAAGAV